MQATFFTSKVYKRESVALLFPFAFLSTLKYPPIFIFHIQYNQNKKWWTTCPCCFRLNPTLTLQLANAQYCLQVCPIDANLEAWNPKAVRQL